MKWAILMALVGSIILVGCQDDAPLGARSEEDNEVTDPTPVSEVESENVLEDRPLADELEFPKLSDSLEPSATGELPDTEIADADDMANANVLFVKAQFDGDSSWLFTVTVEHPDTGWEDYADGWDVVLPNGLVVKPDRKSPFTRLLLHPHVTEQPFSRSQSGIKIPPDIEQVTVRAHDLKAGFGGSEVVVNLKTENGPGFEVAR